MTPNEYQKLAERTSATATNEGKDICIDAIDHKEIRLLHAGMGLCTEAGEFNDQLKRSIFYGKNIDEINLAEEIGDILWYCVEALNALEVDFQKVMEQNIAKLQVRYGDKFTPEEAITRDLDYERTKLEQ